MVGNARVTWGYFTYRGLMVNYNPQLQLVDGAQVGIFTDSHGTSGILGPGSMVPTMRCHESLPWHPFLISTIGKKNNETRNKKANWSILKMLFLLIRLSGLHLINMKSFFSKASKKSLSELVRPLCTCITAGNRDFWCFKESFCDSRRKLPASAAWR